MESMLKIINECLKDADLEKVTKAELRKQYLKKVGVTELSKEDKKLFSSAVNTAYLNFVSPVNKIDDSSDNTKKTLNNGDISDGISENMQENSANNDVDSSSSEDITSANVTKEFMIGKMKIDSEDEPLESFKSTNIINDSRKQSVKRPLIISSDDDFAEKMESKKNVTNKIQKKKRTKHSSDKTKSLTKNTNSDSEEESVISLNKKKSFKRKGNSGLLEDEPLKKYSEKKSKPCKVKENHSSESEDEPLTKYSNKKPNSLKKTIEIITSDSEDEPLTKYSQKKSRNLIDSEDEPLTRYSQKKSRNIIDSEDEPVIISTTNESLKNNSSESENEPVIKFAKDKNSPKVDDITIYNGSNDSSFSKVQSRKSFVSSSDPDSENETVIIPKKKNTNSLNQSTENNVSDSENVCVQQVKNSPKTDNMTMFQNSRNLKDSKGESVKSMHSTSNSNKDEIAKNSDSEDEPLTKYSKKKLNNSIDSEDEPVTSITKRKSDSFNKSKKINSKESTKIISRKSKESTKNSSSESEDEPLTKKKSNKTSESDDDFVIPKMKKKSNLLNRSSKVAISSSDSEDEPLTKFSERKSGNSINFKNKSEGQVIEKEKSTVNGSSSDESEEMSLMTLKKRNSNSDVKTKNQKEKELNSVGEKLSSIIADSSEDEPLSKFTEKKLKDSSDSEDEPLINLPSKESKNKSERSSSLSADENDHLDEGKNTKKIANDPGKKKEQKHSSASEKKIEHLKKYVRAAGIRVKCYMKLFENCKSVKAKCEKLMHLLEKEGLKGRPTLEKCKKLKKKIETQKEIAELDVSNILVANGRSKRAVCSDATNFETKSTNISPVKRFSRLKGIVDSEESD